ncbi:helix-turn-helix domain-containing protein [Wukongibacter sp. M2B1]|uniref:helix-turn-helix domain-containing protein n=1 Tax=Wukongibacter sp. M2B1 TaxID=3088895 RepID=UPI003D79361D
MSLGQRLKQLRKEKELTIREVAKLFSIGKSTLSDWENERRNPNYDMIKKLAEFYGVTVDYLLGITDEKNIYTSKSAEIPDELKEVGVEYIALAKDIERSKLTPDEVRKILDAVKGLKDKEK